MRVIDLNADLGEQCGDDTALLGVVSTASIAAGGHAGGGEVLLETVRQAVLSNVAVGAHPSYVDRAEFGRVSRLADHDATSLASMVRAQVLDVIRACDGEGTVLTHVKAHGALYHDVSADVEAARAFVGAVADLDGEADQALAIMGPPSRTLEGAAADRGMRYLVEAFADRAYLPDGTLAPRSSPGAVRHQVTDVVEQALSLAIEGRVRADDGSVLRLQAETICLHGDTAGAVELARAVRAALETQGFTIQHPERS